MAKVEARVVMELMGRPPEHLTESLQTLVTRLGAEKGINLLEKKYHPPEPLKDTEDLYTAFAEVDVELDSISTLLMIIFIYSPSNLEVISPQNLKISNDDLNAFFNSLLGRIHEHTGHLKRAVSEREILLKQILYLKEMVPEVNKHIKINLPENTKTEPPKKPKARKKTTRKKSAKKSKK